MPKPLKFVRNEAKRREAVSRARLFVERQAARLRVSPEEILRAICCGFTAEDIAQCGGNLAFVGMIAGRSTIAKRSPPRSGLADDYHHPWHSLASARAEYHAKIKHRQHIASAIGRRQAA